MSAATSSSSTPSVPKSVIIVGSGAFGLSTAWALCRNPEFTYTSITVVDRQTFPTPDGSSVRPISHVQGNSPWHTSPWRKQSQLGSNADRPPDQHFSHHPSRLRLRPLQPSCEHCAGSLAHRLCHRGVPRDGSLLVCLGQGTEICPNSIRKRV